MPGRSAKFVKIVFAIFVKERKTEIVKRSIRSYMGGIKNICMALGCGTVATGNGRYTLGITP